MSRARDELAHALDNLMQASMRYASVGKAIDSHLSHMSPRLSQIVVDASAVADAAAAEANVLLEAAAAVRAAVANAKRAIERTRDREARAKADMDGASIRAEEAAAAVRALEMGSSTQEALLAAEATQIGTTPTAPVHVHAGEEDDVSDVERPGLPRAADPDPEPEARSKPNILRRLSSIFSGSGGNDSAMKFVEFSYEQQTATNGGPFMENRMMNLIREGRDIALAGSMPEQRHLRYAVMTGRLAARVIGSMVDFGCDPSDAMDYCVSPKMVRTLVKLGGNPSKLTYFDHPCFVHECTIDASNEEKFRKPRLLFKTFRQRILLGGVFPAHFADWYDEFLNTGWEDDTSDEFLAFRDLYKAKVGRRYSLYKMTVEFARYTKFLPGVKSGATDPKKQQQKKQRATAALSSNEDTDDEAMDTSGGQDGESASEANEDDSDGDSRKGDESDIDDDSDNGDEIVNAGTEGGGDAGNHKCRWSGDNALGDHLCSPVSQEAREHKKWCKGEIEERKKISGGTWAKAGGKAGSSQGSHAISAIKLEELVVRGLTSDKNHLEIVENRVYFDVSIAGFKEAYNTVTKVNPGDIEITPGETTVKMNGVCYTVVSIEDGLYSLAENGGSRVINTGQWEVLENRVNDGQSHTTLEADQRKFVISLLVQYGNLFVTTVPYFNNGQATIPEREGRVKTVNMTYKMKDASAKDGHYDNIMAARSLTKIALQKLKVVDAIDGLRFSDPAQEGDNDLRAFAEKEGSLGELNGLQNLLDDNSGLDQRIMLNMKTKYPEGFKPTGDFKAAINHMLRVQQYAYRLGRPISIHEAYHPLCGEEVGALRQFFRGWEEDESDFTYSLATSSTSESMSWATRLAVRRSRMVCPNLFPASLEIESRDTEKFGSCVASSEHVNVYSKIRKAKHVIGWILRNSGVCDHEEKIHTAEGILEMTKSTVTEARGKKKDYVATTTGKQGDSNTLKKGKLALLPLDLETSEKCLRLMTEAMTKNGWGFLQKTIQRIDPEAWGENGWCWRIVEEGFKDATDKSNPPPTGHAHFGGRSAEDKKRIAHMVTHLKVAGVELRDFEAAWGATLVVSAFNGACLRDQFHRFLKKRTGHIRSSKKTPGRRGLGYGRNVDRVTMWTPEQGKTGKCKERVFDPLCSVWLTVLLVIGWAFYDKEGVVLEDEMGIPTSNGENRGKMKQKGAWDKIMQKVGSTFFGVGNLTLHNLRTVLGSLAAKYFYGKGYNLNDAPLVQLAESMDTGVKMLVGPYNDAVLGPLRHGHLKDEKDADVSLGIQELVSYFADLERKKGQVTNMERGQVTNMEKDQVTNMVTEMVEGASIEVEFIKTMGLSQDFKEFMAKKNKKRDADEGGTANPCGSAMSKKHRQAEDTECLPPRAKKTRTGETYVTAKMMSNEKVSSKIEKGMRFILECIKASLKRAHERQLASGTGTKDPVYRYLSDRQIRNGMFGVVRRLVKIDEDFVTAGGDILAEWECIAKNKKKKFNGYVERFFVGEKKWVWWSDEPTE
eukprot:g4010.t1